jgi:hypothetical protein
MNIDHAVPSDFPNDRIRTSSTPPSDEPEDPSEAFQNYTIQQLQALAQDANVDLSSYLERREMVDAFVSAGIRGTAADPAALSPHMFLTWSVAQLRAVASEANIDVSTCADRDDMVDRLVLESNSDRRYLRDYLRTLTPLTRSSTSELRAVAREMQVDISGCLEKEEIIQRLITRGSRYDHHLMR